MAITFPNLQRFYIQLLNNYCISSMKQPLKFVSYLLFIYQVICWGSYGEIRTGRVDLYDSSVTGASFTSSMTSVSYNISFSSALTQTVSSGIGVVGFQTAPTYDFSLNVSITNFLVGNMRITGSVFGDTIVTYLSAQYIAVGTGTYFLQVQFFCFLPTILSTGKGARTETRNTTTILSGSALSCNTYLAGWKVNNNQATVSCPAGTYNLNYQFSTAQNNTITQICYTTVIFCDICTKVYYYDWGQIGQTWLSQTSIPSASNIVSGTLGRYEGDNRMFWGVNSFNLSRGFTRGFNFQTNYYDLTGNSVDKNYAKYQTPGTFAVSLNHFFIAVRGCNLTIHQWFQVPDQTCVSDNSCWNNLTYTLNGSAQFCNYCHYSCQTCDGALSQNCTACSSTIYRVLTNSTCPCQPGYIDIGVVTCYPCEYFITGCNTCATTTLCSTCFPGFVLNIAGVCQCTTGFYITGVCTTIYGCTSATNLQGTVYCQACNSTQNYVLQTYNYTCVCMSGFLLNTVKDCLSICGDSLTVSGQGCDDGNLVNGDGCNSTCQIETSYYCDNSHVPSICYIISNITATVKYVKRIVSENQVQFGISLNPYYNDFTFMDFGGFTTTNMPCSSILTNYLNNLLIIKCIYTSTIEGNNYTMNLTLDTKFFVNGSKITINLPASGMNAKLTYDSNYKLTPVLDIVIVILDVIAVIALLISCITERMIGVQMIQTLQTVLYTMALMKTCPSTLEPLQYLRYTNGFNEVNGIDLSRRYTYTFSVGEVGLQQQFLLNYNLSYAILMGVIICMLILKGILIKFESDLKAQQQEFNRLFTMDQVHKSYRKVKLVYKFLFQRIFFLLVFMNMFLIFFGVGVQLSNLKPDYLVLTPQFNLLFCGISLCILFTFLSMVSVNAIYPKLLIFPMFMSKPYPLYYVVYNSAYIVLLCFLYSQPWMLYLFFAMTLINLIILMIYTPYPERIHNFTLIFNQITILLALATYIYQSINAKTANNQGLFTILIFVIILMLYICVILSIIRIYRFWNYMKDNMLTYNDPNDITPKDEEKSMLITKQNELEMMENNGKKKPQYAPIENDYYNNIKDNSKNPLNTSKDFKDNSETKRDKNRKYSDLNKGQQDYQTFSKSKPKNSNITIGKVDTSPLIEDNGHPTPYNQYGDVKLHNFNEDDEQYDALKAIKARLKKDFFLKVHGTDYVEPEKVEVPRKQAKQPQFLPQDYYE